MDGFANLLHDYQSLVGALLGLFGVAATLFWNARKERRARETTHRRNARALAVVLTEELRQLSGYLSTFEDGLSIGTAFMVPTGLDRMYSANLSRLGMLPDQAVAPVVNAYLRYRELLPRFVFAAHPGVLTIDKAESIAIVRTTSKEGNEPIRASAPSDIHEILLDLKVVVDNALAALDASSQ
jgi:hypothetical protein